MSESRRETKYPFLAATAYLIVPGKRRKKAAGHFRKAGFEALKGVRALTKPERPEEAASESTSNRQSISID